jgi:hypothetical protein
MVRFIAPMLVVCSLGASVASAQEESQAPVDGSFALQARLPMQINPAALVSGAPQFLAGVHFGALTIGGGLGVTFFDIETSPEDSVSAFVLQVMPMAIVDLWTSADGTARLNVLGGVGLARASISQEETSTEIDPVTGMPVTTTQSNDSGAWLLPLQLAVGGDYFLSRHFGLGVEAGVQSAILLSAESDDEELQIGFGGHAIYGAIRATVLIGG